MSCDECDDNPIRGAFLRFGSQETGWGNIEIVACKKHWLLAREKLLAPVAAEERMEEFIKAAMEWGAASMKWDELDTGHERTRLFAETQAICVRMDKAYRALVASRGGDK